MAPLPPAGPLQKAYLQLVAPSYKGASGLGSPRGTVKFMFNPKEYSITKTSEWNSSKALDETVSMPHFVGAGPATLTVEVFLDATDPVRRPASLRAALATLYSCCGPLKETVEKDTPSPPFVIFGWGTTMSFPSILKSVTVKYTQFRPDGTPIRANASLSLEEVPSARKFQNPTSGGLAALHTHTVIDGDSLASVAHREYGNPNNWRALAEANSIDDPMRLPPGRRLLVPSTDGPDRN